MNPDRVRDLLDSVRRGVLDPDAALEQLARLPFVDVPDARVDTHRALRTGLPEVIFAPGKTARQVADIAVALRDAGHRVLVTRLDPPCAEQVCARLAAGEYDPVARTL
ncbi:MAG TPA: 1-(5-phosphoribosyl)-5-amino-4-imidazole-carboxylate carboxylase, partial [Myxococcota bacterium]|nr:1-(5-phosphoribosyl)-5-amino-4-imidazole-carboxylate carboxylase [Myxococcota bacterium]